MEQQKMKMEEWQWNEMQQVGTDYTNLAEVENYEKRMGTFRDIDAENREMLSMLNLPSGSSVLELGCGTGCFTRAAIAAGMMATAVDVSSIMLEYLREKVRKDRIGHVETRHAGFLTMDFADQSFDAAVSGAALHHLPDAWKLPALLNVARTLKPGGQFILRDVVFTMKPNETPGDCFLRFANSFNDKMRPAVLGHIKKEFSTYDWIMEGLLVRAGLTILSVKPVSESFLVYHCQKSGN